MSYARLSWLIVALCEDLLEERDRLSDDEFLTRAEAAAIRMFEFGKDLPAISASLKKYRKEGEKLPPALVEVLVEATRREHEHFSALIDQLGSFYLRAPDGPERKSALDRSYRTLPQGSIWPRLFSDQGEARHNVCSFYFVHGMIMDVEMKRILADSEQLAQVVSHYPRLQKNEIEILEHYRSGNTRYTYEK